MLTNQLLANNILEIIDTMLLTAKNMHEYASEKNNMQVEILANNLLSVAKQLQPILEKTHEELIFTSAHIMCENVIFSINNIIRLMTLRSDRLVPKIEFELITIIRALYNNFYFFACVFGDKEREDKYYLEDFYRLEANSYIDKSMANNKYKYDLTIYILAYNKLEYTKKCIESIIKYTPNYLNYELVILNNGSTDGTQEYFDSLKCKKEISFAKNIRSDKGIQYIFEGKYLLGVSNDVIVTENYLENLLKCIKSDPKIAMVVPTTPNISNQQTIPATYSTLDEMHTFARENNLSNSLRWEERTRLCNPLALYRTDILYSSKGIGGTDKYFVYSEFGDDALALRLRRAGYKMILAKDCYCYHFGSVTLKESQIKENTLEKSQKLFFNRYGINAWSTGFCYDPLLIKALNIRKRYQVNILGINSGFGSNPLKIKTLHKEINSQTIRLYFVTDNLNYIKDLKVYSNDVVYSKNVISVLKNNVFSYNYIIIEDNVTEVINSSTNLDKFKYKLSEDGIIAIQVKHNKDKELLNKLNPSYKIQGQDCLWFLWMKK
ncbi:glycosyltransferase family 2 protein [Vallitalea guaymasensis]|uniref:glycosyltransferase family 2 protein n=1 Tax=Vallitalea guaymasensis TaxID=1185412 RepID=UPI002353DBAB|nr:glycosyltransferase [Vallitalea guaymasensis]